MREKNKMGVYNSFIINKEQELFCPFCGASLGLDFQEYDHGYAQTYKIGDYVKTITDNPNEISEVITYCTTYGCSFNLFSYIVIENNKFIGIMPSLFHAENLLTVDSDEYFYNEY